MTPPCEKIMSVKVRGAFNSVDSFDPTLTKLKETSLVKFEIMALGIRLLKLIFPNCTDPFDSVLICPGELTRKTSYCPQNK